VEQEKVDPAAPAIDKANSILRVMALIFTSIPAHKSVRDLSTATPDPLTTVTPVATSTATTIVTPITTSTATANIDEPPCVACGFSRLADYMRGLQPHRRIYEPVWNTGKYITLSTRLVERN